MKTSVKQSVFTKLSKFWDQNKKDENPVPEGKKRVEMNGQQVDLELVPLADGSNLMADAVEVGQVIWIETENGQDPVPAGTYEMADGRAIVIDDNSTITEILDSMPAPAGDGEPQDMSAEELKAENERLKAENAELKGKLTSVEASVQEKETKIQTLSLRVTELEKTSPKGTQHSPNPDDSDKAKGFRYAQGAPRTTTDRVMAKINQVQSKN